MANDHMENAKVVMTVVALENIKAADSVEIIHDNCHGSFARKARNKEFKNYIDPCYIGIDLASQPDFSVESNCELSD